MKIEFECDDRAVFTYPTSMRKTIRVRTVEDLYKINLNPPSTLIKPVPDPYVAPDFDLEAFMRDRKVFQLYQAHAAAHAPARVKWHQKLRWQLHLLLLKWGVIV